MEAIQYPDALSDPQILHIIESTCGDIQEVDTVIKDLSKGYHGIPHLIQKISKILQTQGEEPEQIIYNVAKTYFTDLFFNNIHVNGALLTQFESPPEWLFTIANHPFWQPIIIQACINNPKSFLLSYLMNTMLQTDPTIRPLPSTALNYDVFISIFKASKPTIDSFIEVISTDDLTLAFGAYIAHQQHSNAVFSTLLQKMRQTKSGQVFNRILLRLDGCSDSVIIPLFDSKVLSPEDIRELSQKAKGVLEDLVLHKFIDTLFDPNLSSESVNEILDALCKRERPPQQELRYLNSAVEAVRAWRFESNQVIAVVLRAISTRFFAVALVREIQRKSLSDNPFPATYGGRESPESTFLKEVIWVWKDLRVVVLQTVIQFFPRFNQLKGEHVKAIMDIMLFLIQFNYAIEILDSISSQPNITCDKSALRLFLSMLLKYITPPCTNRFLEVLNKFLTTPFVVSLYNPKDQKLFDNNLKACADLKNFFGSLDYHNIGLDPEVVDSFDNILSVANEILSRKPVSQRPMIGAPRKVTRI